MAKSTRTVTGFMLVNTQGLGLQNTFLPDTVVKTENDYFRSLQQTFSEGTVETWQRCGCVIRKVQITTTILD